MNNEAYKNYFQDIATRHKKILHDAQLPGNDANKRRKSFFHANGEEDIRQSSSTGIDYPILILFPLNGRFADDNVIKNANYGSFHIRKKTTNPNNFIEIPDIWSDCFDIGTQIIALMQLDMEEQGLQGPIPNFNPGTVRWSNVGPFNDSEYGVLFTFEFQDDAYSPYSFDKTEFFN